MSIRVETKIKLNKFVPRDYQIGVIRAIEEEGCKRALLCWARRMGKDHVAFYIAVRQMLRKTCTIFYIFPTFRQARMALWDGINSDGERIIEYIPKELIVNKNDSEMKIRLLNGSILQMVGSQDVDRVRGTACYGAVFSEYAMQDPEAWSVVRPILAQNDGWALFVSTPKGRNSFWDLYQLASSSDKWYCSKLTVDDVDYISQETLEDERKEMSADLFLQEYKCSFSAGVEGAYYAKYLANMKLNGQIADVPYEVGFPVHTAWDLGMSDSTVIIFFEVIGQTVRIIDYYENSSRGLEHYVSVLRSKDYIYGKHIAPHDIAVRELGTGMSRLEKARSLGINFLTAPNLPIIDGIEAVRSTLGKCWIDATKCERLVKAIDNYRKEWDSKKKVYRDKPLHDQYSHACFVGETKIKTKNGLVSIKDITVGDLVKTPTGYKKVLKVVKKLTASLCEVSTGSGGFTCTREHAIFTNKGLVSADALRYNDLLEYDGFLRGWLWKKLYGCFSKIKGLKGFKKTILSLRMRSRFALMDTFIDGMEDILWEKSQHCKSTLPCIELYGISTKEKYRKGWSYTTLMEMVRTIRLKILRLLTKKNTCLTMRRYQALGPSLKGVKSCCEAKTQKQKNGIPAQKGLSGIESTQKLPSPLCLEFDIKKYVVSVDVNIPASKRGSFTVLMHVKRKIGLIREWTTRTGIVLFARLYLIVIGMRSKKHAVKSVQLNQCDKLSPVYDLTIEGDGCYYANGYLVSNCDALRYMCVSLPKTRDGLSPEDLDKRYNEALYGDTYNLPEMFRDTNKRYY